MPPGAGRDLVTTRPGLLRAGTQSDLGYCRTRPHHPPHSQERHACQPRRQLRRHDARERRRPVLRPGRQVLDRGGLPVPGRRDLGIRHLGRGRRPCHRARGRPALAGHRERAACRHRIGHPLRVDPRRPRDHVRRRRDHDGLPEHQRRGHLLHPQRLGLAGGLRRGRRAAGEAALAPRRAARGDEGRHLRRHRRRRLGHRHGRPGRAGPRLPGRAPGHRRGDRPEDPARPARHPDLHLRHHRSPQGRAPRAPLVGLRGRGHPRPGPPARGRPAVPVAADGALLRQGAALLAAGLRLRHGHRRSGRQDHREPRGREADVHGRGPPHLREGLLAHPHDAGRRGRGEGEDLHQGLRGRRQGRRPQAPGQVRPAASADGCASSSPAPRR